MTNFKKIIALILTLLMVASVLPISAFAALAETNASTVPEEEYTGKEYDSTYPSDELAYYANAIKSAYNSSSWVEQTILNPGTAGTNVDYYRKSFLDGATKDLVIGTVYTGIHGDADVWTHYESLNWAKGYAGLDLKLDFDVKARANYDRVNFQIRTYSSQNNQGIAGQSFLGIRNCTELWIVTDGNSTGYKVADISTTEYTKVSVIFDSGNADASGIEQTTFYVFVNGELVGYDLWSKTSIYNTHLNVQKDWAATAKASGEAEMPYGVMYGAISFKENAKVGNVAKADVCDMKNVGVYYYDDDADGNPTDSARVKNVAEANTVTLKHYQDFDALSEGEYNSNTSSLLGGSVVGKVNGTAKVIDDGRGGKALTLDSANNSSSVYYAITPQLASGTNFVYSMDYKLLGNPQDNFILFNGCAQNAYATAEYGRDFNIGILYLHSDGGVYLGRKEDATGNGVIINSIGGNNKSEKICTLTKDRFTNLAVAVNVKNNTYRVYVNGVDATGERQFLTDTDLSALTGTNTQGNTPNANGFGLTFRRVNLRKYLAVDNVALYVGDDIINKNSEPLNGYVKENGKLYNYKNGQINSNADLDQGIVVTDTNGAVKVGNTYCSALNKIYTEIDNGDRVLLNGLYDGFYKIGANLYYYEGKNRVTNKIEPYLVGDNAYTFDQNGVAGSVNGIFSNKLFIDGVLQKNGLFDYEGNKYYSGTDGTFKSGVITVNGEDWFFDTVTFKGEKITFSGDVAVDVTNGATYDGIQEALDNAKEDATIKLYGNMTHHGTLLVNKGITLDLNGKTLKASNMVVFSGSNIIDTGATKGLIKVDNDDLLATITSPNTILVYNNDADRGGYELATVKKQDKFEVKDDGDGFILIIRPSLDNNTAYNEAIFGNGDSKITFEVCISLENGNVIKTFYFNNDLVKEAYSTGKALKLSVKNARHYAGQNLTVSYALNSDTGMICEMYAGESTPYNYKLSILGASICTYKGVSEGPRSFYGPGGENKSNDLTDVSDTWWAKLIADKGYILETNQSSSGSPIANTGYNGEDATSHSFITRMANLGNPDIIAIHGGTNDQSYNTPLGEFIYSDWTSEDLYNFRPAYAYMLDYLTENHPNAKIIVIVPQTLNADYMSSIKTICEHYGVKYFVPSENVTENTIDGVHPNKKGMEQLFIEVRDFMAQQENACESFGHSYSELKYSDGEHWYECCDCSKEKPGSRTYNHYYTESVIEKAKTFENGTKKLTCICGDNYTDIIPATKSLKILCIGNSFSQNATTHLYQICKDAGIETVVIGNLHKGGCTLETHLSYMQNNTAGYGFELSNIESEGMKAYKNNVTAKYALEFEDWDYITLQQASPASGLPETYSYLPDVIDYINENKNADTELLWHMTWAYQEDCTHAGFPKYDNDQMTMYNAILSCVQSQVLTNDNFVGVIPAGTAIQNLRTSYLGDTLTQDGYHLDKGIGCYTVGLTYLAAITGYDIRNIDIVPSLYPEIGEHIDCIKDAVMNAIENPYQVTPSAYPSANG